MPPSGLNSNQANESQTPQTKFWMDSFNNARPKKQVENPVMSNDQDSVFGKKVFVPLKGESSIPQHVNSKVFLLHNARDEFDYKQSCSLRNRYLKPLLKLLNRRTRFCVLGLP